MRACRTVTYASMSSAEGILWCTQSLCTSESMRNSCPMARSLSTLALTIGSVATLPSALASLIRTVDPMTSSPLRSCREQNGRTELELVSRISLNSRSIEKEFNEDILLLSVDDYLGRVCIRNWFPIDFQNLVVRFDSLPVDRMLAGPAWDHC